MRRKKSMKVKKVVVLAIDGATYRVLDRLMDWGVMPNLASIFKKGTRGNLLSTLPPMTGVAWASFATGKNPGKHGIFNFFLPTKTLNDSKIISSEDVDSKTFYEILEEKEKKCILINMPVAWPFRLKKGIVIGSFLAAKKDFFFPPKLSQKIPQLVHYQLFPDPFLEYGGSDKEHLEELRRIEKIRFDVAKKLYQEDWDFFFLLFSAIDWLQHRHLGKLLDSSLRKNSFLLALFKDIDQYVGWFVNNLPKNTVLLLLSDHGFKIYSGQFYLNRWLEENGYLEVARGFIEEKRPSSLAKKKMIIDFQKGLITNALRGVGLIIYQVPLFYQAFGFLARLLNQIFPGKVSRPLADIGDFGLGVNSQKTWAYSVLGNFGQIYINRKKRFQNGAVGEREAEKIKKEIIGKLKKLYDPLTSKRAVKAVYPKEEVFSGSLLDKAPDIILEPGDFWIKPSLSSNKVFSYKEVSCHDREGIFACLGPGVRKGNVGQVTLYDFAPTILSLLGIEVPKDMDGEIIRWRK